MNRRVAAGAVILVLSLSTSCTTTDPSVPRDPSSGRVSALTDGLCDFIPAAASVAAIFEVTGAGKIQKAADLICDAVRKRKKEILAQQNAAEADGGEPLKRLPAGTAITVTIEGREISGLTSK